MDEEINTTEENFELEQALEKLQEIYAQEPEENIELPLEEEDEEALELPVQENA